MTREEAIELLRDLDGAIEDNHGRDYDEAFRMAIKSLSADIVQGEWIDKEIPCEPYPQVFFVECSKCGYRVGRETFLENTFNYCPCCGARMKGGAE